MSFSGYPDGLIPLSPPWMDTRGEQRRMEANRARARLVVAGEALDVEDARGLLTMLGLLEGMVR